MNKRLKKITAYDTASETIYDLVATKKEVVVKGYGIYSSDQSQMPVELLHTKH